MDRKEEEQINNGIGVLSIIFWVLNVAAFTSFGYGQAESCDITNTYNFLLAIMIISSFSLFLAVYAKFSNEFEDIGGILCFQILSLIAYVIMNIIYLTQERDNIFFWHYPSPSCHDNRRLVKFVVTTAYIDEWLFLFVLMVIALVIAILLIIGVFAIIMSLIRCLWEYFGTYENENKRQAMMNRVRESETRKKESSKTHIIGSILNC